MTTYVQKASQGALAENQRLAQARREIKEACRKDPFMGYESLESAMEEAKFTSQAEVLARLMSRENLFISGLAGAGKTAVINRFIEWLDAEYEGAFSVALTASTGVAATLIGGKTVHSYFAMGIDSKPFNPRDRNSIPKGFWSKRKPLQELDVLIIDEISMLPAHVFTKIDAMLKYARRSSEPFGGVQMVLIGDFLQLPPVDNEEGVDNRFAIETKEWKALDPNYCFLDKTQRATDDRLKRVLGEIAMDRVTPFTRDAINSRRGVAPEEDKVYSTLFTTNRNVERYNQERLAANPNASKTYVAKYQGKKDKEEETFKKFSVAKQLELKVGAIVMSTANDLERGISNGSLGEVVALGSRHVEVRFNDGKRHMIFMKEYHLTKHEPYTEEGKEKTMEVILGTAAQLPLKLAYAITVHKSQGQTFDGVVVDLSKCFQDGLGYVALSRVRTLDDLVVSDFSEKAYRVSPLSRKITIYVKKQALKGRAAFLEEKNNYLEVLEDFLARNLFWDESSKDRQGKN